jgi:hypothetical protein
LLRDGLLFEPASAAREEETQPVAPPNGNSRSVDRPRGATSVRSNALRATAPVAGQRPKYTRAEIDAMNSKVLREKIEGEPGFKELVASYSHASA